MTVAGGLIRCGIEINKLGVMLSFLFLDQAGINTAWYYIGDRPNDAAQKSSDNE